MPVVLELIVLMLIAYAGGFGIGWLIWGMAADSEDTSDTGGKDGELP